MGGDRSTWNADVSVTPAIEFLLRQPGIDRDRVLAFGEEPARLAAAGLQQADGYEVIYLLAYHGVFGALTAPGARHPAGPLDVLPSLGQPRRDVWPARRSGTAGAAGHSLALRQGGRGADSPGHRGTIPRRRFDRLRGCPIRCRGPSSPTASSSYPDDAAVLDALAGADADILRNHAFTTAEPGLRACRLRPTRHPEASDRAPPRSSITPRPGAHQSRWRRRRPRPDRHVGAGLAGRGGRRPDDDPLRGRCLPRARSRAGRARSGLPLCPHVHVRGLRRRPPGIGRHGVDGRGAAAARQRLPRAARSGLPEGEPARLRRSSPRC